MDIHTKLTLANGHKMPQFGLGTWQMKTLAEAKMAVHSAIDAGYRLFDTAFTYQNEAYLGEVLQQRFRTGTLKREEVFVTSKLAQIHMSTPELIRYGLQKSLDNLKLEYIDLYLIHGPVSFVYRSDKHLYPYKGEKIDTLYHDIIKVWKVLETFVDEGKVKALGVSNFNLEQLQRVMAAARHPVCNLQIEASVYLQQDSLVAFCHQNNITVTAFAPLGSPAYWKKKGPNLLEDDVLLSIAQKHNKTVAQVALRFLLQRGIAIIPKSSKPSRITENSQLFDFELDQEDMEAIKQLNKNVRAFKFETSNHHPEYPFKDDP